MGQGEGSAATGDLELQPSAVPACKAQTPGASAVPQRSRAFIEVPAQARDARAPLAHPHLHLHPVLARGPGGELTSSKPGAFLGLLW